MFADKYRLFMFYCTTTLALIYAIPIAKTLTAKLISHPNVIEYGIIGLLILLGGLPILFAK